MTSNAFAAIARDAIAALSTTTYGMPSGATR
jgi:hypothetical protein